MPVGKSIGLRPTVLPKAPASTAGRPLAYATCEAAGVAVSLHPDVLTADTLVAAVRSVLAEASYGTASSRCAAEIAAMPDAPQVVESLRDWVLQR